MKLSRLIDKYYDFKVETAKRQLKTIKEPKVRIDLQCLNIKPKLPSYSLWLNPHDEGLSAELYAWKIREPLNTFTLHQFLIQEKDNIDAIIDVGSNIGYFPLIELTSQAKQVYAFEPIPTTFQILKKNMQQHRNCIPLNLAVSDKPQKITMYLFPKYNLATSNRKNAQQVMKTHKIKIKQQIQVEAIPLTNIIEKFELTNKNLMIRMDVEGYETIILKTIPKQLHAISMELHTENIGHPQTITFIKHLIKKGYKITAIIKEARKIIPLIKIIGIKQLLKIYNATNKPRIFHNPTWKTTKQLIQSTGVIHIYAKSE